MDVRIISATNRGLEQLVKARQFREDLYYRINVVRMVLPSLVERRDDLPLLIRHCLRKLRAPRGLPPPAISEQAMRALLNYAYPGNIREMENILEHALILCQDGPLQTLHLPDYMHPCPAETSTGALEDRYPVRTHDAEARRIAEALDRFGGHRGKTAAFLGIDRTTLWRKIKRHGMGR